MSNKETTYNRRIKVADLLSADSTALTVLQRFGIRLGFGEATVEELCARYNISPELFLMVCSIYSSNEYVPHIGRLDREDAKSIIVYLRASHSHYMQQCFPAIHEGIHTLVKELDSVSQKLIDKFYDDYDREIINHFRYEEDTVFPYIE